MITLNSGCGKFTNFALQLNVFGVTIQQSLMILHFLNLTFASLPMTTIILCIFGSWLSVTISCQSLEPGLSASDIYKYLFQLEIQEQIEEELFASPNYNGF